MLLRLVGLLTVLGIVHILYDTILTARWQRRQAQLVDIAATSRALQAQLDATNPDSWRGSVSRKLDRLLAQSQCVCPPPAPDTSPTIVQPLHSRPSAS